MGKTSQARFQPRHPALGHAAARAAEPLAEWLFRQRHIHRPDGHFAAERLRELAARLARGETAYVAGISIGGFHNSGVALVEVTAERGLCIICNNEEERFSGRKHANHFPTASLEALAAMMNGLRIDPEQIVAWLATYDYPLFVATGARSVFEELPGSLQLVFQSFGPKFDLNQLREGMRAPVCLGRLFGRDKVVPIIGTVHHDTHAWFSYLVSPFARDPQPVMIAVIDSSGDCASISLYVGESGTIRQIRSNGSFFDSLGMFYSVISSTQGGWTPLSSEGRYMGAAAYGDVDRSTNRFYPQLRDIFSLRGEGEVRLNRSLARWPIGMLRKPYAPKLVGILGPPILPNEMWNPDAVLRVEDINHRPDTKDRVDRAAATQMVFEDALVHIIDWLIQTTGGDRLVLTGGAALNAVANMRLLERFDASYYDQTLKQSARLHLWVPPVPSDAGSPLGAAYAFVARAGVRFGHALNHAFYCGSALRLSDIQCALKETPNTAWTVVGDVSCRSGIDAVADLMAFITANDGIIAIFQGAAETGPRALGHRSILANPCNPRTRELLNERVKYREPIRPLAPMVTLAAAQELFDLSDGASDDGYNAYNYMVLTARAKLRARTKVPAVIHADGTARLQIVRKNTDAVTYSYLKALGRRIGVEVAVNTSFNVAGPIAQSPTQALETLRRAKAMDGVFMFSEEGPVMLAWIENSGSAASGRVRQWLADWRRETQAAAEPYPLR